MTREQDLVCPRCGAANAPGRTVIELQRAGVAFCSVCAKTFTPDSRSNVAAPSQEK